MAATNDLRPTGYWADSSGGAASAIHLLWF